MSSDTELARFDLVERLVHWSTAIMMLTLIVTGAILYLPSLALRVGHRGLVENIHVITDRKSTRLNSSHRCISYAVFFFKKNKRELVGPTRAPAAYRLNTCRARSPRT